MAPSPLSYTIYSTGNHRAVTEFWKRAKTYGQPIKAHTSMHQWITILENLLKSTKYPSFAFFFTFSPFSHYIFNWRDLSFSNPNPKSILVTLPPALYPYKAFHFSFDNPPPNLFPSLQYSMSFSCVFPYTYAPFSHSACLTFLVLLNSMSKCLCCDCAFEGQKDQASLMREISFKRLSLPQALHMVFQKLKKYNQKYQQKDSYHHTLIDRQTHTLPP